MTTTTGTTTEVTRPTMVECMDQLTGHDELEIEKRYGAIIELLQGAKYMRALAFSQELHAGVEAGKAYRKITDLTQAELAEWFAPPKDDDNDGAGVGEKEGSDGADSDAVVDPAGTSSSAPGGGRRVVADSPQA